MSDCEGLNALHIAVTDGNLELVKFLVSRGADAHFAPSNSGIPSPCALAELRGTHPEITSFLKSQPVRDDSYTCEPLSEISNATVKPPTRLPRRGSSTVEFQVTMSQNLSYMITIVHIITTVHIITIVHIITLTHTITMVQIITTVYIIFGVGFCQFV